MKQYRHLGVNGIVIFDRNNPNYSILETNDEIVGLFKKYPVPVIVKDEIVGFVKDVEFWSNDKLIGDLLIWGMINFNIELKNYQVQLGDNGRIQLISCIEYGE